ncbi:MAG TPA: UbiD family decarboxylase [Terriglobales bacterium]|nr:UbiD family decarboxylase [Terriglobales bacterium]
MFDLATFVEAVRRERPRDVVDVQREVNPKHETAAIILKLEQRHRSPLLVFHRVSGTPFPLVTNVCGSVARLALALGCPVAELSRCYAERIAQPIKPELTADAPVQERISTGERVDLQALPQLIYHEHDAAQPYITAAIVVARDPETGKTNLSFHRLMMTGRNSTAIFMAHGKHLESIYRKYESANEAMPIAAFIGAHPTCTLGALYSGTPDTEEYDIIGGLQRAPLRVTKCVTDDLQVPANSEFVLEGVVPPRQRVLEGPFGEFTGYAKGRIWTPVFHVKAITSRSEPLFQDIVGGSFEHLLLPILALEHDLLHAARAVVPNTVKVKAVAPLTVVAAIEKTDDSQPEQLMRALLSHDIYVKQVIVVDSDVDIGDLRQVTGAIALHVRPDRDVRIYPQQRGTELDPSAESEDGATAKLGLDATMSKSARDIRKNTVPQRVLDSIDVTQLLDSH